MKNPKTVSQEKIKAQTQAACLLYYRLYAIKSSNERRLNELRGQPSFGCGAGQICFSGSVHLYDVLLATRSLRKTLHEQQTEILALEDFDPDAAFKEIEGAVRDLTE